MSDLVIGLRAQLARYGRAFLDRAIDANPRIAHLVVGRAGSPSLWELYQAADAWSVDAAAHLALLPGAKERAEGLIVEARAAFDEILGVARSRELRYPDYFPVERETAQFLYGAVRVARPNLVLETGVADGLSSAMILSALDANRQGELHSVDIAHDVGTLVRDHHRWKLHVITQEAWAVDLERLARELPPIDAFFHDSNHDRYHQVTEYTTFWPHMTDGGLFMSDDVDFSYAFLVFAGCVGRAPALLLDRRKVFGFLIR